MLNYNNTWNQVKEMLNWLTSKTVQNEIIGVIGEYIKNEATKLLQLPSAVYTIIADEVTDKYSNKEIMSLCLRLMDSGKIK